MTATLIAVGLTMAPDRLRRAQVMMMVLGLHVVLTLTQLHALWQVAIACLLQRQPWHVDSMQIRLLAPWTLATASFSREALVN